MEIVVKRKDIPGGIKFTTKDCEYPRHFASTIRQALLLDGVDEDTVDEIFGVSSKSACVELDISAIPATDSIYERLSDIRNEVEGMRYRAAAMGVMPLEEPEENQSSEKDIEWELPAEILTNDCEVLSANSKADWYKKMVLEMRSQLLVGDLTYTQVGDRVALIDKEKGLIIEPHCEEIYVVATRVACNRDEYRNPNNGCKFFGDLLDAIYAVNWSNLGEKQ